MNIPPLCQPLADILASELRQDNEIKEIIEFGWSKIDLSVTLKYPFKKDYLAEVAASNISFYRQDTDSHYAFEDSYISTEFRQALSAPINNETKSK